MTTKSLVYKVARFNDESNTRTLQQRFEAALKKRKTALKRRQQTDSEHHFRLVNYNGPYKTMRVGEMFDYTSGAKQPTATLDDKAESLALDSVAPANKKAEFLHSILYFGIRHNAVILSQSITLKSLQFESYLNWILRECGELTNEDFVALNDQPPANKKEALKNAKGVTLSAPVELTSLQESQTKSTGTDVTGTNSITMTPSGKLWDKVKDFFPSEVKMPKGFDVDDVVRERSLEIKLTLSWNRTYEEDSTDFMDNIANQLRHVDTELDYSINTKSGVITRDQIKLRKKVPVQEDSRGLIRRESMWECIYKWLERLVVDKLIEVEPVEEVKPDK